MLTILIPAYNNIKTLKRAVECLSRQTIAKSLSLIISDDCSPELSLQDLIALQYSYTKCFREIRVYRQDQNLGVMSNKEWLYNHSSTEYVAFHEHDDWIINCHFYEAALDCLISTKDACCFFGNAIIQPPYTNITSPDDHSSCWMYRIDDRLAEQQSTYVRYDGLSVVRSLINSTMDKPFNTSWTSLVIRKECLEMIGGFAGNYALTVFEADVLRIYREEEHFAFIYFMAASHCFILERKPSVVRGFDINAFSRSPNNPARKLKQDSSFYAFYKLVFFIDRSVFTSTQKEMVMLELLRHCVRLGIVEKNFYSDYFINSYSPKLDSIKQLIPAIVKKCKRYV